ncbi:hypothetical protein U9M73_14260 [Paenibacillus phoenicis]|uniref:Lipoprotein n=1 Tax=Paenibacillus phoenicis TaxID=554117 RepID=A0ABU5PNA3_9BACL|nr:MULTISPECIES: hypothetical protein [Paenibacillus]MCT2197601.1 hypothetical protein [Paenibacillus sp. p3-SID1389]MEA3571132.1 hypothetical protein [Paenibacillus phoenicis]
MKIKFGLVLLIFIFVFVGCNSNPKQETDNKISKEIISLQGQSDHWTANYTIRETEKSSEASKYLLQCTIEPRNSKELIFDVAYNIASPSNVSQLSGTITSETDSYLSDKVISPSIDTNFLPRKGEDIIITIKWNKKFEEKIVLTP